VNNSFSAEKLMSKKHLFPVLVILFSLLSMTFCTGVDGKTRGTSSVDNTGENFGAGIILGEPTGFTLKYFLDPKHAIDGGLAYSFGNFFEIYSDYLYHFRGAFGSQTRFVSELTPYVGGGLALFIGGTPTTPNSNRLYFGTSSGSAGFGIRIPLGIEWKSTQIPLGVFVEFAPGIGFVPATFALFQGGIGARYYFY
jgi:hypothetical protein